MFDALAPGKLVLTLRSTPPFVAESAFALALTILLAAPLIVRVYLHLDKPLRALTKTKAPSHRHRHDSASRSLSIHYPPVEVADSTSSSSLQPGLARRINSTPALRSGGDGGFSRSASRREIRVDGKIGGDRGSRARKCPSGRPPLPLADSRRPVVDMSGLDYGAYRHRLIEATLRRQYDDLQPPGDVVLNSLHLNSADSVVGVRLNDRYDHSLFDFVEEYYDVGGGATGRRNDRLPHPLRHFLPRGARRPRTTEKETETVSDGGADRENGRDRESVNGDPPGVDDNGNPCVRAIRSGQLETSDGVLVIATSASRDPRLEVPVSRRSIPTRSRKRETDDMTAGRGVEDDYSRSADRSSANAREESSRARNDRPGSAGNASKVLSCVATPESQEATGSWGPGGTSGARSRESRKKGLEDHPAAAGLPPSGKRCRARRRTKGGTSNPISTSSSEIASVRGDSSKRRDDASRESSVSPGSRASPRRPPWLSGNRGTSFNRKYGRNVTETSAGVARPTSARGSDPHSCRQKSAASSRGRPQESSTASSTTRDPASLAGGRRAASFVASRGKGSIGAEDSEKTRGTSRTTAVLLPSGRSATMPLDSAAPSFSSSSTRPRKCSSRAALFTDNSPATASEATKKPEVAKSRRDADGARGRRVEPAAGNNAPRLSPAMRDRRENLAKLNRDGGRGSRGAENPSKGAASLSPRVELSEDNYALNPADDKSATPDGDPRGTDAGAAEGERTRAEGGARTARTGNDVRSSSADDVARPGVPSIARARPASAYNLPESRGPGAKGGLNGAADETTRRDGSPRPRSPGAPSSLAPRDRGNVVAETRVASDVAGRRDADEGLQLPRRDSKVGLAMNSALKRYIGMLKQGLLDHGDRDGVALASLSLSDAVAILSEQRTPLSPEEIQELQTVLDRIERNPELLCKLSCPSTESVA